MSNALVPRPKKGLNSYFQSYLKWSREHFFSTPERALEQAYQAALKITEIEKTYFQGEKISNQNNNYSQNTLDCFLNDLEKHLSFIRLKLAEFKVSRFLLHHADYQFLEKTNFIDQVLLKYQTSNLDPILIYPSSSTQTNMKPSQNQLNSSIHLEDFSTAQNGSVSDKKGALPRSIGRTFNKIKTQIDPRSEEQLLQSFRASKRTTKRALTCLLLMILIPVLTQKLTKEFLIFPNVEKFRTGEETSIFINAELKEEAMKEIQAYEEELKFENRLHQTPIISPEEMEEKLNEKAQEIAESFKHKGNHAISNVFADIAGVIALTLVVLFNRQGVAAIKLLLNDIVYSE